LFSLLMPLKSFLMKTSQVKNVGRLIALALTQPCLFQLIYTVRRKGLTYLGYGALLDLYQRVQTLERQQISGTLVEAGTALGGSALLIAAVKAQTRPFFVFDAFGMIPHPSVKDGNDVHQRYDDIRSGQAAGIGGSTYYGYEENLLQKVEHTFTEYGLETKANNISLVKGLYEDCLYMDQPVALAHIDCDWYESVMVCLERIVPNLVIGGVLVIDDYFSWSGCRTAVDDFFATRHHQFTFEVKSRLHIIRHA
jgi:hypothetical protein